MDIHAFYFDDVKAYLAHRRPPYPEQYQLKFSAHTPRGFIYVAYQGAAKDFSSEMEFHRRACRLWNDYHARCLESNVVV
jgi:hypothetical protein